jgi:DNA invertase Pin-like site-specific DNA recombinase
VQAEHGYSLEEQERRLREFTAAQGMDCVAVYIDAGLSGRSVDKRSRLQAMLDAADEHAFDVVVIPSLDRLGRNAADMHKILLRLEHAGVGLRSLRGDVDTSSATGKLITGVMASVAEFESNLIGERTSVGKRASAAKGKRNGGPRPFGYTQADRRLTIVPTEAQVLRRMRTELLAGRSMRAIAADLNQEGITTTRGAPWSQGRVSQMFNPSAVVYIGKVRHRTTVFQGDHEPVFTDEEWEDVQNLLSARRARPGKGRGRQPALHLFGRGMLRCGCCGASMTAKGTRYYCHGKSGGGSPDCTMPGVSREAIDSAVLNYFQAVGLDLDATRRRIGANVERAVSETRAALTHAERERAVAEDRLIRVKRDYQDERLDAEDWREQRADLRAELNAATSEVERLTTRLEEVAGQEALLDSEQEMLDRLAELRHAVAGRVTDTTTVEAMRAALLRVFDGFTLHAFDEPEVPPALPAGWVRSMRYTHPELLIATSNRTGVGGVVIEPHPRRDMILDDEKETTFPQLHRVPLEARVRMSVSGR